MRRAEQGGRISLAFLGGSITQESVSSRYTNGYAYLVYDWFVRRFPKTAFTYINAGVGGTTSQFGAARAEESLPMPTSLTANAYADASQLTQTHEEDEVPFYLASLIVSS